MRTAIEMGMILKLCDYKKNNEYENFKEGRVKESIKFCETTINSFLKGCAERGKKYCTFLFRLGDEGEITWIVEREKPNKVRYYEEACNSKDMDLTVIYKYLIKHGYDIDSTVITYNTFLMDKEYGLELKISFPKIFFPNEHIEEEEEEE